MKKRLFAAVVSLFFYILFVVSFSMADNSGQIPQVLSKFGLTDNTAFASSTHDYFGNQGRFIDPVPEPKRPPASPN
ncbi:hypothetical protein IIA29_11235 [candidate division KSB1 bacterium]|nr:hypothetical protein [candidate division KSB1 bacterium]